MMIIRFTRENCMSGESKVDMERIRVDNLKYSKKNTDTQAGRSNFE